MKRSPIKRKAWMKKKSTAQGKRERAYFKVRSTLPQVCYLAGVEGHECSGRLECHHIKHRRHLMLYNDRENLAMVCHAGHVWLHNNETEFKEIVNMKEPGRIANLEYKAAQDKSYFWALAEEAERLGDTA